MPLLGAPLLAAAVAVLRCAAGEEPDACNCSGGWLAIQQDMWHVFRQDIDLATVMDCLARPACELGPGLQTAQELLASPHLRCSEEELPDVDARFCPAGMLHHMLICALQMWLRRRFRQSALYFEQGLGYLALAQECLEGSDWPLWPGQVLRNYRNFLRAAFPPGGLRAELRTTPSEVAAVPVTYTVAGPDVDPAAFRWHTGPRRGFYCPPLRAGEGSDELAAPAAAAAAAARPPLQPSVLCAVPVVWPGEEAAAEAIAATFGPDCSELVFFLAATNAAAADEARAALQALLPSASVVDLAEEWPGMVRDSRGALHSEGRRQVSSANQKDLLLFAHLAARGGSLSDWVCRVETDAYFAPANFQRFVTGRGLDPAEPWFLGSLSYWHIHFEPRVVFNEQVQCLSRASVLRLAERVQAAPVAANVTYTRCELSPGHRGDLLLAICLAEAGIVPLPDVADGRGREYFLNYRLEDVGAYAPDLVYGAAGRDVRSFESDTAMHWRGKAHIFMPCLGQNRFWASPFPVSFHDYKDPQGLRRVHEVLTGRRPCGRCPEGYAPRLASRPWPAAGRA